MTQESIQIINHNSKSEILSLIQRFYISSYCDQLDTIFIFLSFMKLKFFCFISNFHKFNSKFIRIFLIIYQNFHKDFSNISKIFHKFISNFHEDSLRKKWEFFGAKKMDKFLGGGGLRISTCLLSFPTRST